MNIDDYVHSPVLVEEVIHGLDLRPDGIYVDCTFGRGGHSRAILEHLGPDGTLFVFDQDPEAVNHARRLAGIDSRLQYFHASFTRLFTDIEEKGKAGQVDGILFDLGVSSPQIEDSNRGFSFTRDGNLDMRMNPESGSSAAEWINAASQDEISHVLKVFGEEKFARRVARAIVGARLEKPVTRTQELANIISAAIPVHERHKHPATRSFQAIRIYINNELEALTQALEQAFNVLRINGRLLVISFHSLEDRIVKRFMREYSQSDPYPKDIPVTADLIRPRLKILGKAVRPGYEEIAANPRARSATLRIGEKLSV